MQILIYSFPPVIASLPPTWGMAIETTKTPPRRRGLEIKSIGAKIMEKALRLAEVNQFGQNSRYLSMLLVL